MTGYIVRRLIQTAIALVAIVSLIFLLLHLRPGGPCGVVFVEPNGFAYQPAPPTVNCVDYFRLDQPLVVQYLAFLGNYLHGNLGHSLERDGIPVLTIVGGHLPATILLITVSFALQQFIALPLGMLAAVRRYSLYDGAFSVLSYLFLATPPFVLGLVLLYFFTVNWQLLPSGRASDIVLPVLGTGPWFQMLVHRPALILGDTTRHLVLPVVTLAVVGIALDSRFMRASMLQVLNQEYIRTARAKGVSRRAIIFKHAFRNALPPIITNIALYFPALIGSAMVVETVFTYTGVGYSFTQAILKGDTATVQGIFLLSTVAVLLANLAADVAYAMADPRVNYR